MPKYEEVDLLSLVNEQARKIAELERELASFRHMQRYKKVGDDQLYWRNAYLESKLRRQTEAINKMQKRGWQPTLIIREVPYPDDKHLWDNEPTPESHRRAKRRPSVVIEGT